LYQKKT